MSEFLPHSHTSLQKFFSDLLFYFYIFKPDIYEHINYALFVIFVKSINIQVNNLLITLAKNYVCV